MIRLEDIMKIFLLITAVLLITTCEGRRQGGRGRKNQRIVTNTTDFDLLIFTQHWPQTVCYTWKEEFVNHTCLLPKDDEWTIHGIWPTQKGKLGPSFCNKTLPFQADALAPIEDSLKIKWIDIENGTKPYSFWKHEWEKHGTCATNIYELNTEYKYFKKGLDLLDEYDMKHVLAKANILPGQAYLVRNILDGVAKVLGKRGQVTCVSNPQTKQRYLFEVRICFDKSFNLIDCNGIADFPTNCSRKKTIMYPSTVPNLISAIQI